MMMIIVRRLCLPLAISQEPLPRWQEDHDNYNDGNIDDYDADGEDDDDCTDYVDLWQYLNNHSPPLAARSSVKPPPPQRCVHHRKRSIVGKVGKNQTFNK